MNRTPKGPLVLMGVFTLLVLMSGCKGGTQDVESVQPKPVLAAPTTTMKPLTVEQRDQVLAVGVFRAADLGDGWTQMPMGSDKSLEIDTITDLGGEENCQKLATTIFSVDNINKSRSEAFEAPDGRLVQNSITTFENSAQADKLLTVLNRTDNRQCMDKAYEKAFARQLDKITNDGSTLSNLRVRKVSVPSIGDNHAAFEITLDLKDPKTQLTRSILFTRVAVEVGPSIIDFSLRANEHSFPNVLETIKPVVSRVNLCLGSGQCE